MEQLNDFHFFCYLDKISYQELVSKSKEMFLMSYCGTKAMGHGKTDNVKL